MDIPLTRTADGFDLQTATTPTNLAAHSASRGVHRLRHLLNDPERGALPTLYAATQDLPGNSCIGPHGPGGIRGYPQPASAATLWAATEALPGMAVG